MLKKWWLSYEIYGRVHGTCFCADFEHAELEGGLVEDH